MEQVLTIIGPVMTLLACVLGVILLIRLGKIQSTQISKKELDLALEQLNTRLCGEIRQNRQDTLQLLSQSMRSMGETLAQAQVQAGGMQDTRLRELNEQLTLRQEALQKTVNDSLLGLGRRFSEYTLQSEQKLDNMRTTMQQRLSSMQEDNAKQMDKIRATVDEKLQKTLEDRIGQSFQLVSQRLEQVYKGLGEMQTLAMGVGDLKKVLSNVKTRGILGEIQLGGILEQILAPEQYAVNVATKKGSANVVEFAVKLPGDGETPVYLPIDAKFPADAYAQLMDAYDSGSQEEIQAAGTALERRIKQFAKDIRDKYIDPPATTDFAILFLPVEGLYAEAVRRGLVEALQGEYHISLAGPTTMAALLNSLQMGFKTLAIQKRSSEVWNVLGAVKTEFGKFGEALANTQSKLEQTEAELEKLVGVRTRQIQRRLSGISALPEGDSARVLEGAEQ